MVSSEVEKLFRAFAEERKRALPRFTPDGIPITMENKFDDAIYHYLYAYWKEQSGEYDPKDDEIIMTKENSFTKNEKKFEQWLLQQYGMTNKEQREYTVKGNLESLWEIFSAADMVLLVKALPNIGKNLVQLGKDVLENGIQFDTSLGIVAGGGEIWNLKNIVDDVAEEAIEKTVKREVAEEAVEKTVKTEVSEEVAENTAKKEVADTAEDLSQKTVDKDNVLEDSGVIKGGSETGKLTVLEGEYSVSERRAAQYMADQGKDVVLRPPVGTRADGGTSDLLVNGVNYDVYTPITNNPSAIIRAITKKNTQTTGVVLDLSETTVTIDDLGDILARVKGAIEKNGGVCNIDDVVVIPK